MKAFIRVLVVLLLLGGIALYFFSRYNHTSLSPQTIDLTVDCKEVGDMLVTSTVNVSVQNLSSRSHEDISVKIKAYDAAGHELKEKYTTFSRTLLPKSIFDKLVTLPAGTKRCDCQIVSSKPVN